MRKISSDLIQEKVAVLCRHLNFFLPQDVDSALRTALQKEEAPLGREVLEEILENARIAGESGIPLCQDGGVVTAFVEIGQDVHLVGDCLTNAIHHGVRRGYTEGYLRASMVTDPIFARKNTDDNTPAVVHVEMVPGNQLKIYVMAKGGGSDNSSRMCMLPPAAGAKAIKDFVLKTVEDGGRRSCPPILVGVGVGGTFEMAPYLAKKSLLRDIGSRNPDHSIALLEGEILEAVNKMGLGPMGYGGTVTALDVFIEVYPCHIASLPVAVNLLCHSARHGSVVI